jgi:hypothetical protein
VIEVNNDNDSVALVRERTIPTERPRLSTNLLSTFADREVSRSQRGGSSMAVISSSRPEQLLFLSTFF